MSRRQYLLLGVLVLGCAEDEVDAAKPADSPPEAPTVDARLAKQGRDIFRFETFGDERFGPIRCSSTPLFNKQSIRLPR